MTNEDSIDNSMQEPAQVSRNPDDKPTKGKGKKKKKRTDKSKEKKPVLV
jgi:hypothetical protein